MRTFLALIIGIIFLTACGSKEKKSPPSSNNSLVHHIVVEEVIQTSSYTYMFVMEEEDKYWIAVSKMDAKTGDDFYYQKGMEMKDFNSKELDRTFSRIFFIDKLSTVPVFNQPKEKNEGSGGKKTSPQIENITIEPVDGGITIAELYKSRNDYSGKIVIVRGKVVKVNNSIMNRNWVHLQDGTNDAENFDLTVTTLEIVNVGEVITIEGKVALNKEFGAGYTYELIVEEAVVR